MPSVKRAAAPPRHGPATGIVVAIAGVLTGAVLVLALAGCGSSGGPSAAGTGASSARQQALPVWLDFAHCVRAHGVPGFPDPQVDSQGRANFGSSPQVKNEFHQAQGACGAILNQLPASARGNPPVTPLQLHQLLLFAGCMRHHGLPTFPDPKPDGTFQVAGTVLAQGKTPQFVAANQACQRYNAGGRIYGS